MGVPDSFWLPPKYNDAYRAIGDGVAVPVVRWLSERLIVHLAGLCRDSRVNIRPTEHGALGKSRLSGQDAVEEVVLNRAQVAT